MSIRGKAWTSIFELLMVSSVSFASPLTNYSTENLALDISFWPSVDLEGAAIV